MTRKECLDKAAECVLRDRNREYGGPERSFSYIADLWSAYLRTKIEPYDAAAMMALFKLARLRFNPYYEDGWADLAGYAACGAELAGAEKACEDATRKWGEEYRRLRAEAEGDAKAEDCEEPKFKPGDRVQYRVELPSVSDRIWVDATYLRRAFDWQEKGRHIVTDKELGPVTVEDRDIRPAPKAEGCEELVHPPFDEDRMRESMPGIVPQDGPSDFDAPQTREALYQHIVDCNPATFKARTPTGEELAEMAEEEAHE